MISSNPHAAIGMKNVSALYISHFGLSEDPFSIAPDPRYLFMSERHREALAHLLYGLDGGGGFVLLSGEIGAGKTTVCRRFLEQIPPGCHVAYIFNPRLSAAELLGTVCEEFGITLNHDGVAPPSLKHHVDALNAFLLERHAAGQNCVLIIDEAQSLSTDVLEQLRLLTNLETATRKLLQIILIGQPQLRDMLARPELEQLAQRVIARFHLGPLSEAETAQYVAHRLAVAGHIGPPVFDAAALRQVHRLSAGVPRRINLLCGRALLGAFALGRGQVDPPMLMQAAREVFGAAEPPATPRRMAAATAVAVLAAALGWGLGRSGPQASVSAAQALPAQETRLPLRFEAALKTRTQAVPPPSGR